MGWIGQQMMNPEGKIGKVIDDDNGTIYRVLTVKFKDETKEKLWLANLGRNPIESQDWKWLYDVSDIFPDQKPSWVKWGS